MVKSKKSSKLSTITQPSNRDPTALIIFVAYILILVLWNVSYIAPPLLFLLGQNESAESLYQFHSYFCHQKLERSFCFFSDGSFGDCMINGSVPSSINPTTGRPHGVVLGNLKGFELACCARDNAIYLTMLIGGLILPFFKKIDSKEIPPPFYLVIAIVPIAIDGAGQLIGLWESTNIMRVVTGAIAGFTVPFYLLPMLNSFFSKNNVRKNR